jgi:Glyoxalase-like domain
VAWFLHVPDLEEAAGQLRAAGIAVADPARFEGVDGSWLDLASTREGTTPLPTLTRRLDLPRAAWPPPLARPHANGAARIAAIRIRLRDHAPLATMLTALGATRRDEARFELDAGAAVEFERAGRDDEGIAALRFDRGLLVGQEPRAEGGDVGGRQPAGGEDRLEIVFE